MADNEGLKISEKVHQVDTGIRNIYFSVLEAAVFELKTLRTNLEAEFQQRKIFLDQKVNSLSTKNHDWRVKYEITQENLTVLETLENKNVAEIDSKRHELQEKLDSVLSP